MPIPIATEAERAYKARWSDTRVFMAPPANCTLIIPQSHSIAHVTQLHQQCLSAKSLLLRALFRKHSHSHPVLVLPVPDPSSIQHLIHWMYSGNTHHIEHALHRGDIRWDGLARNVEYLGLSTDIKVFLGRWYRSWYLPADCPADDDDDDQSDSDSLPSDDDDDERDVCGRGRSRDIKSLVQFCGQLRV